MSSNILIGKKVLENLARWGVRDILLCAGARNAPFVYLLENSVGFNVIPFFEERSAGFFALGKAQKEQRPVAVITTSGTAAAELLPAAIEATYTQTPLIFVTADRPRSYRGTGAPQTIEQVGMFYKYVETCLDIESLEDKFEYDFWTGRGPLQINTCFKEPLIDGELEALNFSEVQVSPKKVELLQTQRKFTAVDPLVIVGPLTLAEAEIVEPILLKWGAPIFAESLSNLRKFESLKKLMLQSHDSLVRSLFVKGHCKSVIRLGGVPTLRFWRDLEEQFSTVPVFNFTNTEFSGLSRPSQMLIGYSHSENLRIEWQQDHRPQIFEWDKSLRQSIDEIFQRFPKSEPALLKDLSKVTKGFIYLGNSLPVREWDLLGSFSSQHQRFSGNRGANGIDGQISAFLGGLESGMENWGIFGDLTALYDLVSLAFKGRINDQIVRIVIVNNSGGMIFKEMFKGKKLFLNEHHLEFSNWAQMFGFDYIKVQDPAQITGLQGKLRRHVVIEVVTDGEQTDAFNKALREIQ